MTSHEQKNKSGKTVETDDDVESSMSASKSGTHGAAGNAAKEQLRSDKSLNKGHPDNSSDGQSHTNETHEGD